MEAPRGAPRALEGHRLLALLFAGGLSLTAVAAHAEPPAAAPSAGETSAKREVPDYDGRGPHASPGSALLWVPRVILAPVYVVSEYVLREPLSVAVPAAEHADLPRKLYDFFTFGPEHKAGFVPIGFAEFDFNPSVGLYAFWDDAGFEGDDLRLHAEAWPTDWLAGSLVDRVALGSRRSLTLRVSGFRRPDRVFYGVGPTSLQTSQSRYGEQRLDGGAALEWRFWRMSRVEAAAGARTDLTYDGSYGTDPSLTQEAARGAFSVPGDFGQPFTAVYDRLALAIDTRRPASRPGSGARLELDAEQGSDVQRAPASGWLKYGATAAGYLDLNGLSRVLGLSVTTLFVDPLGPGQVPFTQLVYLGGDHPMSGYFGGRVIDRSAAVATLSYAWPIGPWLDGHAEVAAGNVFGTHLASFDPGLVRLSAALGVSVAGLGDPMTGTSDAPVQLLVGIGSETVSQGAAFDSVRVSLGVPHTF